MFRRQWILPALALLALPLPLRAAEDPQETLEAQFGARIAQAQSSSDFQTSMQLGTDMIDAAKQMKDPQLQALTLMKVITLVSVKPEGVPLAIDAAKTLTAAQPDYASALNQKILDLYDQGYRAAQGDEQHALANAYIDLLLKSAEKQLNAGHKDTALDLYHKAQPVATAAAPERSSDIAAHIKGLSSNAALDARIALLKKKLDAAPTDGAAIRELTTLLIVEKNAPEDAEPYTRAGPDKTLAARVAAAVKKPEDLTDAEALQLGDFYQQIARPYTATKVPTLQRARDSYARFLQLHTKPDEQRTKTTLAIKQLDQTLKDLTAIVIDFKDRNSLSLIHIQGDFVLTPGENGGLDSLGGRNISIATTKAEFTGPLTATFEVYCLPDGPRDIRPGLYSQAFDLGLLLCLGWSGSPSDARVACFSRFNKIAAPFTLQPNTPYTIRMSVDAERNASISINGKAIFTGDVDPAVKLEGPVIIGANFGHVIYRKVTINGTLKKPA